MMKAVQFTKYGGPDVLGLVDAAVPQIGEKEVLIDVKAIGVNYADTARREGQYVVPTPLPFIPGAEIAGIVTEVGKGVQGVEKGKRVVKIGRASCRERVWREVRAEGWEEKRMT